jgi:ribosome biogenesis GTPase A
MDRQNINWYPGHMSKTRRALEEDVRRVDAVIEVLDARIPRSSQNPDICSIIGEKPRLVLLNRADQADREVSVLWKKRFAHCVETVGNAVSGVRAVEPAVRALLSGTLEKYRQKGQAGRSLKVMVAGIPNVGKSSLINSLTGRKTLKAENRPGVTRQVQWVRLAQGIDLLDTPGMLWPKLGNEETGLHLAFTGAIKDAVLDTTELAGKLMETLKELYPQRLMERYNGTDLEAAARRRGFLLSGGELDIDRMALTLLDEFRSGKLGRISLEKP